jgi:hypothetical protein
VSSTSMAIYAKSTLVMVPLSLVFFIPFILPSLAEFNFATKYIAGLFSLILVNGIAFKFKLLSF